VTPKVGSEETKSGDTLDIYRDRYETTISLVRQNGIEVIKDVKMLSEFMGKYGEQIGAISPNAPNRSITSIQRRLKPLSWIHSASTEKPLPGQANPGLLPIQRHVATAVARALRKNRRDNIQGEMGSGKTTMALAALALLDAFPALIMCDPHMVEKWMREAKEVVPGIQIMELRRLGGHQPQQVNDVERFFESYEKGLLGKKAIAVIAHTTAKLGSGWRHSYVKRRINGIVVLCWPNLRRADNGRQSRRGNSGNHGKRTGTETPVLPRPGQWLRTGRRGPCCQRRG